MEGEELWRKQKKLVRVMKNTEPVAENKSLEKTAAAILKNQLIIAAENKSVEENEKISLIRHFCLPLVQKNQRIFERT